MEIIEYDSKYKELWEDFLENSNNGTIFSSQSFLSYHPPQRFEHNHLLFEDRGKLISLFPAAICYVNQKKILVSHPGASFGSFITRKATGVSEAISLTQRLIDYCLKNDFNGVEITRPPWIYYEYPEDHFDFALFNAGAHHTKRELSAVVPIFSDHNENLSLFKPEARTAMRRAKRSGITISLTDRWAEFYEILKKNLSLRHGVKPTHTLEEIKKLDQLIPGRLILFGAFLEGIMIAGSTIFICNPRTMLSFYISQDYEHQNLRPLNLLFTEIMNWASINNFKWLDFGTYTLNNIPNFGLARFKESLGAKGIFRDTLSLKL